MKYGTMGNAGMQSSRNVSVSGKVRVDELMFFFFSSSSLSSTIIISLVLVEKNSGTEEERAR